MMFSTVQPAESSASSDQPPSPIQGFEPMPPSAMPSPYYQPAQRVDYGRENAFKDLLRTNTTLFAEMQRIDAKTAEVRGPHAFSLTRMKKAMESALKAKAVNAAETSVVLSEGMDSVENVKVICDERAVNAAEASVVLAKGMETVEKIEAANAAEASVVLSEGMESVEKVEAGETEAYVVLSKAIELFIKDTTVRAWTHADAVGGDIIRTIGRDDFVHALRRDKSYDFLAKSLQDAKDPEKDDFMEIGEEASRECKCFLLGRTDQPLETYIIGDGTSRECKCFLPRCTDQPLETDISDKKQKSKKQKRNAGQASGSKGNGKLD